MLRQIYDMNSAKKRILPKFIGKQIWQIKNHLRLRRLRRDILQYYRERNIENEELAVALQFVKNKGVSVFPHPFQSKYHPSQVEVFTDQNLGLHYVLMNGQRLYFRKDWTKRQIQQNYYFLTMEQDPESPHRYLTQDFKVNDNDVVLDIGAAEGNFSLSVIEKAKSIYLFETNSAWIEALEATFAPWKEKVRIVNKFVTDSNDHHHTTLDNFLGDEISADFIKIDVDGAERSLLKGFDQFLSSSKPLKLAICTYHQQQDWQAFSELLSRRGFKITTSKNYMLFIYDEPLQPPYFRRGLIRAIR